MKKREIRPGDLVVPVDKDAVDSEWKIGTYTSPEEAIEGLPSKRHDVILPGELSIVLKLEEVGSDRATPSFFISSKIANCLRKTLGWGAIFEFSEKKSHRACMILGRRGPAWIHEGLLKKV